MSQILMQSSGHELRNRRMHLRDSRPHWASVPKQTALVLEAISLSSSVKGIWFHATRVLMLYFGLFGSEMSAMNVPVG